MSTKQHAFTSRAIHERSWLQKMAGNHPKGNLTAAVYNLLAAAESVLDVTADNILQVAIEHGERNLRFLEADLACVFEEHLAHCVRDHTLSTVELAELRHLREILGLPETVLHRAFQSVVDAAARDGHLTAEEREHLNSIQSELGISDESATAMVTRAAQAVFQARLEEAIADKRLSPEEDAELARLALGLGANVVFDTATKDILNKYRYFWLIENGPIPPIPVDIAMQKGEVAYWSGRATAYERRKVMQRVGYSGPALNIRLMKGVYWRAASYRPQLIAREEVHAAQAGTLYITSKRLLFVGERATSTIRLSNIVSFIPYSDGMEVQKGSGKNPIFGDIANADILHRMLARAVQDS